MHGRFVHPLKGPAIVELDARGVELEHRFGRLDQPLRRRVQVFETPAAAQKALDHRAFRLISKGYTVGHHHPGLLAAIADEPDDPAPYAVYADWLAERGDPRAELMARTASPQRTAAIADLLQTHRWQFIRRDWDIFDLTWWMGFVRTLHFPRYMGYWHPSANAERDGDSLIVHRAWARSLLLNVYRHPSGRFLRRVEETFHHQQGWQTRQFAVRFELEVEPWIVRLLPLKA
jgi:uncharacterized protein (TIGR02996 family)